MDFIRRRAAGHRESARRADGGADPRPGGRDHDRDRPAEGSRRRRLHRWRPHGRQCARAAPRACPMPPPSTRWWSAMPKIPNWSKAPPSPKANSPRGWACPPRPPLAEAIIVERDIRLVELTGARYHFGQISTRAALDAIAAAKAARPADHLRRRRPSSDCSTNWMSAPTTPSAR